VKRNAESGPVDFSLVEGGSTTNRDANLLKQPRGGESATLKKGGFKGTEMASSKSMRMQGGNRRREIRKSVLDFMRA